MKTVCISVESLYEKIGVFLTYGTINKYVEDDSVYYDFYDVDGVIACMDGEEVEIVYQDNNIVELLNKNGEPATRFKLTKNEFEIATYK